MRKIPSRNFPDQSDSQAERKLPDTWDVIGTAAEALGVAVRDRNSDTWKEMTHPRSSRLKCAFVSLPKPSGEQQMPFSGQRLTAPCQNSSLASFALRCWLMWWAPLRSQPCPQLLGGRPFHTHCNPPPTSPAGLWYKMRRGIWVNVLLWERISRILQRTVPLLKELVKQINKHKTQTNSADGTAHIWLNQPLKRQRLEKLRVWKMFSEKWKFRRWPMGI